MKGVILAAGIGKRLRPFTYLLPNKFSRKNYRKSISRLSWINFCFFKTFRYSWSALGCKG